MALAITVSKSEVNQVLPSMWNITLNLICLDGEDEVINQNFSARYRTGDTVSSKEAELQELMQNAIDKYIAEQVIFNHAQLTTVVTNLNNNLEGG